LSISYPCLGRHALYRSGVLVRVVGRWAVPSRCSVLRPLQAFRRGDRVQVAVVELAVGLGVRARVDRGLVSRKRRCQGQTDGAGGEEGRAEGRGAAEGGGSQFGAEDVGEQAAEARVAGAAAGEADGGG